MSYQLRIPALNPKRHVDKIRSEKDWRMVVILVIERRRNLLGARAESVFPHESDELAEARMVVYAPGENVSDGASEYVSSGFFDLEDAPPWDLWGAHADGALLAWVPPALLRLAQKGIEVNVVDCLWWLR